MPRLNLCEERMYPMKAMFRTRARMASKEASVLLMRVGAMSP